jgi:Mg2+ and Co2+ transporter CorA
MKQKDTAKRYAAGLLICLFVALCGGCRFCEPSQKQDAVFQPSPVAFKLYRQAVVAYQAGEYAMADKLFTDLRKRDIDKRLDRMALYGLACTRLMQAEIPKEYQQALALWENWVQLTQHDYQSESPMLLDPLIRDKMVLSNIPLTPMGGNGEIDRESEVAQWMLINAANELGRIKNKLAATEKTAQKRKKRIGELEKKIAKLQRQIKALETIDQKIQKKKSAIPSADTPAQP